MREEKEKLGVDRFKEWSRDAHEAKQKLEHPKAQQQLPFTSKKPRKKRASFVDFEAVPILQINGGDGGGVGGGDAAVNVNPPGVAAAEVHGDAGVSVDRV